MRKEKNKQKMTMSNIKYQISNIKCQLSMLPMSTLPRPAPSLLPLPFPFPFPFSLTSHHEAQRYFYKCGIVDMVGIVLALVLYCIIQYCIYVQLCTLGFHTIPFPYDLVPLLHLDTLSSTNLVLT